MRGIAPTSVGLPVERLDAHLLHPRRNVLAADLEAWRARSTACGILDRLALAEKICA